MTNWRALALCLLAAPLAEAGAPAEDRALEREFRPVSVLIVEARGTRIDVSVWERQAIRIVGEPTAPGATGRLEDAVTFDSPASDTLRLQVAPGAALQLHISLPAATRLSFRSEGGPAPARNAAAEPDAAVSSGAGATPEPGAGPRSADTESPPGAFKVDVGLVNLNVKVTDRTGKVIPDLTRDDFQVFEDGALQSISHFAPASAPINLVLLLDLSGSTREKQKLIKRAAKKFVESLAPADQVAVAAFTRRFLLVSRFTRDRKLLKDRIDDLENFGSGTAYYDAMWSTLDLLEEVHDARKAIVVMTDGVDNSITSPRRMPARHSFDELLARAAEEDATIYPVYLDTEYDVVVRHGQDTHDSYVVARKQVEAVAEQTGGMVFKADRIEDLEGVYARVSAELRMLYSLAYASSNARKDGRWRAVSVRASRPNTVSRTRRGYFAR